MVLSTALLSFHPAEAKSKRTMTKAVTGNAAFQPAQECSKCHSDIFRNWKQSLHAAAYDNPVFLTAYWKAWLEEGAEAARSCLPCHAPASAVTGDYAVAQAITHEGVTCISCHESADSRTAPNKRPDFLRGDAKRPIVPPQQTGAPGGAGHDGYFARTRPCADCHDFENRRKVRVATTFSEWNASPAAANGESCQKCHMPFVAGRTANKGGHEEMHGHSFAANLETIHGAVTAEITGVAVGNGVTASITLRNIKAGHYVPTGSTARTLILEVRLINAAGDVLETQKRIYRKSLADKDGNEILSYGDAVLHAASVTADNRLAPGETRVETIVFTTTPSENATVAAELYLLTTPNVAQRIEMKIPLSAAGGN